MNSLVARGRMLLTAALVVVAAPVWAQTTGIPEDIKAVIRARVDTGVSMSIVVGVVDASGTQYFGYGQLADGDPRTPDEHTVYEIGSISKAFTGVLLADMVERGEVRLDDPITRFLPEGVRAPTRNGKVIRLVDLATHSSGLPRMPSNFAPADAANPYADYTVEQMYEFLNGVTLQRDIGAQYEYSNYGMGLLGQLLANRAGMSYEALMVERIAGPRDLADTRVEFTVPMRSRLALGHNMGIAVANWDIPALAGAGAIRSTAADMLTFIAANMGLVETPLLPAMRASHAARVGTGRTDMQVALAWHVRQGQGGPTIWHNGGTGGYRTFTGFREDGSRGVVVLTNSSPDGADDIGFHLLDSSFALATVRPSVAIPVHRTLASQGVAMARARYRDLREQATDAYDYGEPALNTLGYLYLQNQGDTETAIELFRLNVEMFPGSANAYDSLGEAFMLAGETDSAVAYYQTSLALNPANTNARERIREMGAEPNVPAAVEVTRALLDAYAGTYERQPGVELRVWRDGDRLMGQVTGQPAVTLTAIAETRFAVD
ncbi:MAG: serine hydrolase, partial [Gemmatimonadota bacterium]|nr:serine hydrolase [Gemmatimonadota bacterium]